MCFEKHHSTKPPACSICPLYVLIHMATEDYWEMLHEHASENIDLTKNCVIRANEDGISWKFQVVAAVMVVVLAGLPVLLNENRGSASADTAAAWWKTCIVYQIYPRSFKDSQGDGVGDFIGIISKLDHLTYINVGAIWISPFYPSPMFDGGYDVSNYTDVDPVFGSLDDFDKLLRKVHKRGIRVIIDFVAGHTSSEHQWFQNSVKRIPPYTDFYIWANGIVDENGTIAPPSNWVSTFGHSAWTWREERQQFYYHAYLPQQPNLDYRNPVVRQFMKEVIRFWMDRGVDGLRVDAVYHLMVSRDHYLEKPRSFQPGFEPRQAKYYDNSMTQNIPEIGPVVREWRDVLNSYTSSDSKNTLKFMVVEVHDPPKVRNRYFEYGADMAFNFDLLKTLRNNACDAVCFYEQIKAEYDSLPEGRWPNFVLSNHDSVRASSRLGLRYADALHVLLLTLRGTPTTYYGEEIAMRDVNVSYEDTQDSFGKNYGPDLYHTVSRDPGRTPMQWDDTSNAGFTTASRPWLPVHPNYTTINVKAQKNAKSMTTLKVYRKLSLLRKEPSLAYGDVHFCVVTSSILSYTRTAHSHTPFLAVMNLGKQTETSDFSGAPVERSKGRVKVVTFGPYNEGRFVEDSVVSLSSLTLQPGDGLVLELLSQ